MLLIIVIKIKNHNNNNYILTMHPILTGDRFENCNEFIQNLQKCHEEYKLTKFLGACTQFSVDLNSCLQKDVCIYKCIFI